MVAAAFLGPGTITTATLAGAGFGYTLLWAVLFSVLATILLQEMAARLGLIGRLGLGEAIRLKIGQPILRFLASLLVIAAILIGNAAYEAGNITGAVLGLEAYSILIGGYRINPFVFLIALIAFFLLYNGKYRLIEWALVAMVGIMSVVFIITAAVLQPDIGLIIKGMFLPVIPDNAILMVVGLIGTTIVPYNLFLHASAVQKRWPGSAHLSASRWDTIISVALGGLITMAIVITASAAFYGTNTEIKNAVELALPLRPVLGEWAGFFLSSGFLAAGLSSSITAPLAAAFAAVGILGWSSNLKSSRFRIIWIFVLSIGVIFSLAGFKPIAVILFAQVANGLLLPVIVIFLLWAMNDRKILGKASNRNWGNILGVIVLIITLGLGLKSILSVFKFI